jgi:gluconolactonase
MTKDGTVTTLVDSYKGKGLNSPNDLWVHPDGSIYFTDPRYRHPPGPKPQPSNHVFRISPDGKELTSVNAHIPKPNGIIGTNDGKTLYISDTESFQIFAYDIEADGSLSNVRVFAKRLSDGMTLDERGNLYLTDWEGIAVYNPEGKEIEFIPVPEQPANVAFGGKDGKTLYVAARTGLYSIRMTVTK